MVLKHGYHCHLREQKQLPKIRTQGLQKDHSILKQDHGEGRQNTLNNKDVQLYSNSSTSQEFRD